jgi:serine/threonine-protein kinase HipA
MDRLGVYFDQRLVGGVTVDESGRFSFEYDESWIRLAPFYDLLSTAAYPRISSRLAMAVAGRSDPGQIQGKNWRALAKTIGVGGFVEDTVRQLAEELPERAETVRSSMREQYGRLPVAEIIVAAIRKRSGRSLQLLKL